ncbi:hypothetical protein LTR36_003904 [Oleoguttula mirabilis]|uniref:DUF6590 domain-containing protein n=1 Tax=Oleoguttula mirabilis TaxID=1507867 RepID=A0AAV9JI65_9PEZI|nr:hypothetical protein LTR36_003904 [Oleoguttula mirabilis]
MVPNFQPNTLYQDSRTRERYKIVIHNGYYWQMFEGGRNVNRGPVNRPQASAGGQAIAPIVPVPQALNSYDPRTPHPTNWQAQAQHPTIAGSPGSSDSYTVSAPHEDADATPRAKNAFPQSLEQNFARLGLGPGPLTSHSTQYGHYENHQYGKDQYGTAFATADGPRETITDPTLRNEHIFASKILLATSGTQEPLDPSFKQRPKPREFFKIGKVFLVLWSQPSGVTDTNASEVTTGRYRQLVHSKIRRFVVVREGSNFCSAVQIATYGSNGVSKRGVKKSDHAIVYTGKTAPNQIPAEEPSRGEEGMRPGAIRIDTFDPADKLDPMSRINFGKVYTIEHYLKVKGLGMVVSTNELTWQFRDVWNSQAPQGPSPQNYVPAVGLGSSTAPTQSGAASASQSSCAYPAGVFARPSLLTQGLSEQQQIASRQQTALQQRQVLLQRQRQVQARQQSQQSSSEEDESESGSDNDGED